MAEHYLRQDPLAHRGLAARAAGADEGVGLWQEAPLTQLALRGDAGSARFAAAVKTTTGVALPATANRASRGEHARLLWMGPDEWLVVAAADRGELRDALETALAGEPSLVSDVSHSRTILALAGPHARQILAKGMSIDLHPRAFDVNHVAQSALARIHALVHRVDDAPTFHLYVHRSFADYALSWLEDAAAEYGIEYGSRARRAS